MKWTVALGLAGVLSAADIKVVAPANATVVGPYSPGLRAGDFLYVSGQGAANAERKFADNAEQQTLDTLKNIQSIVEAAGLTMEHIVYSQVYVKDASAYDAVDRAWKKVFSKGSPARAVLGVFKMPTDTPIEINAVAIADLSKKTPVRVDGWPADAPAPPAVIAGDRVFISGMLGREWGSGRVPDDPAAQVQLALDQFGKVLKAAKIDFPHVVFTNPYLTDKMPMNVMNQVFAKHFEFGNTPARATIRVNTLPGANIEFTGVAVRDLSARRAVRPKNMDPSPTASPCVFAGDTFYCSAKSGFIPGPRSGIYATTVEHQVRQTMRNLLDGLQEAGLDFSNVVATNVYLDDLEEFTKMNGVYAQYFTTVKPTRTTVQPLPPVERKSDEQGRYPKLEEISLIAVK